MSRSVISQCTVSSNIFTSSHYFKKAFAFGYATDPYAPGVNRTTNAFASPLDSSDRSRRKAFIALSVMFLAATLRFSKLTFTISLETSGYDIYRL
jgi:hypothetical protein